MDHTPLVEVEHLSHSFYLSKQEISVLNDISFDIKRDEIFGLVGGSGSGKSTLARCIMNIYQAAHGNIFYDGIRTTDKKEWKKQKHRLQRERQIIFQDSTSALNRYMKVLDIIAEPLRIQKIFSSKKEEKEYVLQMMDEVELSKDLAYRKPYQLSGGQRQRVAIARAFGMKPKLLIADEPVSSLDVSLQMQMIELFLHLKEEHDCTILFISHDLLMVQLLCDRAAVMNAGKIVECGDSRELLRHPVHPYTKQLVSAIPVPVFQA